MLKLTIVLQLLQLLVLVVGEESQEGEEGEEEVRNDDGCVSGRKMGKQYPKPEESYLCNF